MDISVIDATKATTSGGITIGSDNAPKKMIEYLNVRCPYCKKWFFDSYELLTAAVAENKVQRIIKLFDKEKPSLQRGNVMHHFVTVNEPTTALHELSKIFESQSVWGELDLPEVAAFAEAQLGLQRQYDESLSLDVINEAAAANITLVPTVIVGEHIFDENISQAELKKILGLA